LPEYSSSCRSGTIISYKFYISRLYRDPTWKSLQTAAASTTQLYKSSIDVHRRGFEKGFRAGRISLAKVVLIKY
ncbi:unnamed protein product, partial [Haemonchus placei]|uniref:Ovule protein n=1 Tax=Haemonchus placei TaxID=6290 RepID=A0A0N4VY75_HAEPC